MKAKKFFFGILLIGYLYILYRVCFFTSFLVTFEGTGLFPFRSFSELVRNRNIEYLKSAEVIMAGMIPFGFFYPLTKGRRCRSRVMLMGAFLATIVEISQYILSRGATCFDDILLAVFGTWLGYKLFIFACKHTSDGQYFIWPNIEKDARGLITYLLILVLFFSVFINVKEGNIGHPLVNIDLNLVESSEPKEEVDVLPSTTESIYDTILTAMQDNKSSFEISGLSGLLTPEMISEEFKRVVDDHPELFWLTGSYDGMEYVWGPTVEYIVTPGTNCKMEEVPIKKKRLDEALENVVSLASNYESDYDKAAFAHDYIIVNCEYDINSYYEAMYAKDNYEVTSHSHDCYGCLIEKSAVCDGYSKAYKLILNQLGIQSDIVSGTAINDFVSGGHAWNSVTIDGTKYYVDVTWDDPLGYVGDSISRDYFLLTYDEICKDHFEE